MFCDNNNSLGFSLECYWLRGEGPGSTEGSNNRMCLSSQACLNEEIYLSDRHEEDINTAHDMRKTVAAISAFVFSPA